MSYEDGEKAVSYKKIVSSNPSRRGVLGLFAAAAATVALRPARAQASWPDASGRIVNPYSPGTSTDNFARMLASQFEGRSDYPFIVENRPGASGWTGTLEVTRAEPDGHTLVFNVNHAAIYGLLQNTDFDATVDLTPIAMTATAPVAILVTDSLPVNSVEELVEYAKSNEVAYASSGIGSAVHLYTEMFKQAAGVDMTHIPYRGLGASLADFIAGRIHVIFSSYATGVPLIDAGQARLIGYGAEGAPAGTPQAPTVKEAGIDYEAAHWWGVFGPPGMSTELRDTINQASNESLADPAFVELLAASGVAAAPMSADEFKAAVAETHDALTAVVKTGDIVFE
jgi:tripartite-type tricarboxylate transporter receptor subunit TctC